jgi:hypothetical protein
MKVKILQRIERDFTIPGSYYEPGEVAELNLPEATLRMLIDYGIVEPVGTPVEPAPEAGTIVLGDGVNDAEARLAGRTLHQRKVEKRHG